MPTRKSPKPVGDKKERRKPEEERKEQLLRVRVTAEQKRVLTTAAEKDALDVSSWLRNLGIARARELGVE